uniref:Cytochrome b n=1 Tax=Leptorhynchoides thecatus TaxID=60532 RepID=CYB_LEPTH|nr:cytochrome b [Leptorhynchoides thecatus]Q5DNB7.1 RecName: Full=Cytochrome b; AltName: Full=Complex III subunit 3; AltName: Full=Complex III subunit III; AltName: Full=Cytochrome b-c1 complex subunit 3; AltName: Full=Ubiquinol-cytochrome-c reductase complex cytochrome b subunit [Leptorhynchoides thecatus]AAT64940.1 cytochrome b [Leptorhynchoides thecatus]
MFFNIFKSSIKGFLLNLPTPINLNYWYGFGSMLGLIYSIQIISGLILSWFYFIDLSGGFKSLILIMQDVWGGWFIRFIHSSGVSLFMFIMYLHILRGLIYGSFCKVDVWYSGILLLFICMGSAFLGYVLPWGSMSYWGMTVVTNMLSAIPMVGVYLVETIWGGSSAGVSTLVRFFSFHYLLSLFIMVFILIHLILLHECGSSNPLGVYYSCEKFTFHPLFSLKDTLVFVLVVFLYWFCIFVCPYLLLDAINFEEINFMMTPSHIKPEWYFLFIYCILRSTPSKLGGVILMVMAILMLVFLGIGKNLGSVLMVKTLYWKLMLSSFLLVFIILTIMGGYTVEYPYDILGNVNSVLYFFIYVIMLLYSFMFNFVY